MVTLLAFLVALTLLIYVHEMGHYLAARWFNVKVLRFSIGFGKSLYSWRRGPDQTEWSIGAIPLGGYVAMLDERAQDTASIPPADLPRAFTRQTLGARSVIVAAGPIANFALAALLYAILGWIGVQEPSAIVASPPPDTPAALAGLQQGDRIREVDDQVIRSWNDVRLSLLEPVINKASVPVVIERQGQPATLELRTDSLPEAAAETDFMSSLGIDIAPGNVVIGSLLPGSAALAAGLVRGDQVLAVDNQPVVRGRDMIRQIRASGGQEIEFKVLRDGLEQRVRVTPELVESDRPEDKGARIGRIGAEITDRVATELVRHGPIESVMIGVRKTWDMSLFSLRMFGQMITGGLSVRNLSGPVTIAGLAGETAKVGWFAYVGFLALISISLGVLNLLPIPVLDGGHLVYYGLEAIRGKPLSERVMEFTQKAGIGVIVVLMSVAIFNDIARLIGA